MRFSIILLALAILSAILLVAAAPKEITKTEANAVPNGRLTVRLANGNLVSGDLLKEKPDALILDLGFTVVSIPASEIVERTSNAPDGASQTTLANADTGCLYTEGNLASSDRTVKDLADGLGNSVALVTTPAGLGSSFAIDAIGHFVTNFHVIEGEREITLTLSRNGADEQDRVKMEKVRVVAVSPFLDLALLKADLPEGVQVKAIPLGSDDRVVNGQTVFAIGNPLGLEHTVSEGIVSSARRSFEGQLFLQTTAPINPGNSGGPLFNLRGEVVGVTNMKAGWFSEGLSFAIPVDTLKFFLRNRDVLAFDKDNPNSGFHYLSPPRKPSAE